MYACLLQAYNLKEHT